MRRLTPSTMTYTNLPFPQRTNPLTLLKEGANVTGTVGNAARTIAGMRADFRKCYTAGLAIAPDSEGSIRVSMKVDADGLVSEVSSLSLGLPVAVVDCILLRASQARFDPTGDNDGGVVAVPAVFVKK